ncbi:MAG TPA: nuclear transport factor 2 family protein [Solirubrobacteraceae bacterium]|nr:nuclear transport factor 2 family protein [Solirubrobacteraceae bacterium]
MTATSDEITALMTANLLEVFGERDAGRRREAIARIYHPDVEFADPDATVVGHEALDAKAQGILDGAPGFVFSPAGPVYVNNDLGYLAWQLGPEGAPPVVRGVDIALVRDGLIAKVYTLLLQD